MSGSAVASPSAPKPSDFALEPGERMMKWTCPSCRRCLTLAFTTSGADLIVCPACKVQSILVVGDMRERPEFPEEIRYHATGVEPPSSGHPMTPMNGGRWRSRSFTQGEGTLPPCAGDTALETRRASAEERPQGIPQWALNVTFVLTTVLMLVAAVIVGRR